MHMVYLVPKSQFTRKLDRDRFASVRAMKVHLEERGGTLDYTGPEWDGWNDDETAMENLKRLFPTTTFDLALLYEMQDERGIAELPITKVLCCSEMYSDRILNKHAKNNADYVILHHTTEQKRVEEVLRVPTYHIPHGCDHRVFKPDANVPRRYDFALIGRQSKSVYPLRHKLLHAIYRLRTMGYRCYVHKHPGYELDDPDAAMHDFVNVIRSTKIALTCSSVHKYRLSKYAEVPLCGTALAADIPRDGKGFFKQFIVQLKHDASIDAIVATLIKALPRWKHHAEHGRALTLQTSLQSHYAERFFAAYTSFMAP